MRKKKESSYVAAPEVPPEMAERVSAVLDAMTGETYVSEGARKLSLSRPQFQSLVHKATAAVIEALTPKAPGPTPVPEHERALSDENERLKKQLARMQRRVDTTERMGTRQGRCVRRGRRRRRARMTTRNEAPCSAASWSFARWA